MISYSCDWCGETVDPDEWVELRTSRPRRSRLSEDSGYIGHYHEDCWTSVHGALHAAHDMGQDLEALPTGHGPDELWDRQLFEEKWVTGVKGNGRMCLSERLDREGLSLEGQRWPIHTWGIRTLGDLHRAVEDGTLLMIKGIGPKTFDAIRCSVLQYVTANGGSVEATT